MAKYQLGKQSRFPGCGDFDRLAAALNAGQKWPKVGMRWSDGAMFAPKEVEAFWEAWRGASNSLAAIGKYDPAKIASALKPLVAIIDRGLRETNKKRGVMARLTSSGTIGYGLESPEMDAVWTGALCLDTAMKSENPHKTMLRLRRCATCQKFFHDAMLSSAGSDKAYCGKSCRKKARSKKVRTNVRAGRAREFEEQVKLGLNAPPGKCIVFTDQPSQQKRVMILMRAYGYPKEKALGIVEREIAKTNRALRKKTRRRG